MTDPLPKSYPFWPEHAQDRYNEAIALARQDMPDSVPLPWMLIKACADLAEREIREAKGGK
jgi:hypothetical protein